MSAEVEDVLPRIALIEREILNPVSGSAIFAYDNPPLTISPAQMPCFVNFATNLLSNTLVSSDDNAQEFEEVRQYQLRLYLNPVGSGIEGEQFGRLTPFFKPVFNKFASYPHLKNLGGVRKAQIVSDAGMLSLPTFMGQTYFGIIITLQVVGRVRRVLGPGE